MQFVIAVYGDRAPSRGEVAEVADIFVQSIAPRSGCVRPTLPRKSPKARCSPPLTLPLRGSPSASKMRHGRRTSRAPRGVPRSRGEGWGEGRFARIRRLNFLPA
jgi:hypothetical protein